MTIIDKFLNEVWVIGEKVDGAETKKHLEEFEDRLYSIESDCQDDHSASISILKSMGYEEDEIEEIIEWFKENGGFCDCEVVMNVLRRYC